jgi:hypothetical protein
MRGPARCAEARTPGPHQDLWPARWRFGRAAGCRGRPACGCGAGLRDRGGRCPRRSRTAACAKAVGRERLTGRRVGSGRLRTVNRYAMARRLCNPDVISVSMDRTMRTRSVPGRGLDGTGRGRVLPDSRTAGHRATCTAGIAARTWAAAAVGRLSDWSVSPSPAGRREAARRRERPPTRAVRPRPSPFCPPALRLGSRHRPAGHAQVKSAAACL